MNQNLSKSQSVDKESVDNVKYPLTAKVDHPLIETKTVSKAELAKLNKKYGSYSKNFVKGETSKVSEEKPEIEKEKGKVNIGHLSMKELSDRLDKIEVKTDSKKKSNRNGKVGINKHNNYTPDKYAPRKTCAKCGSVNHISVNCKSVSATSIPIHASIPQMPIMNNMPEMPGLHNASPMPVMPAQFMNAHHANMPFATNPYFAFNMPQVPYSMPYWNNLYAPPMP